MDPRPVTIDYESRRVTTRRPSHGRLSSDGVQVAMGAILILFAAALLLAGAALALAAVVHVSNM